MTNEMKRILEELGTLIVARKPELKADWTTLLQASTSPKIAYFLDEHFPIRGSWGVQGIRESPRTLEKEYPL